MTDNTLATEINLQIKTTLGDGIEKTNKKAEMQDK